MRRGAQGIAARGNAGSRGFQPPGCVQCQFRAAGGLRHLRDRVVDREGVRLLDRREVLERVGEFRRTGLREHDEVPVV